MNEREHVAVLLRDVKALPTLPDVAVKLLEMGESPTASAHDLAVLVEKDVALATRVLKLVNSPFFGMRREVDSVQQALLILGIAKLRGLVLSGAAVDMFDREGTVGKFSRKEFWKHSVAVGAAARTIAARRRTADPELAFTAGLIHDMGKVVEDRYLHPDFEKIVELMEAPGMSMSIAEKSVLGVTHTEIGHHLAVYWNLPETLRDAVGFHHKPQEAPTNPRVAALVNVADAMVRQMKIGDGGGVSSPVGEAVLRVCGLDEEHYEEIMQDLSDVLDEQVSVMAEAD
jgi:putative nucleotidyltransferase with HDIG domain